MMKDAEIRLNACACVHASHASVAVGEKNSISVVRWGINSWLRSEVVGGHA